MADSSHWPLGRSSNNLSCVSGCVFTRAPRMLVLPLRPLVRVRRLADFWCKAMSGIFRERYGECMDIRKLLASGLLVGVMALGAACQWLSPAATPTATPWPTAATPMTSPSREELPSPAPTAEHKAVPPAVVRATAVARRTDSTPTYIWIPKYADPFMADQMINSYLATVVTLCTGIFGGAWSPGDPNFWETLDICAVNAQLGFPDPTGVATKGCVSKNSGCEKYHLKR